MGVGCVDDMEGEAMPVIPKNAADSIANCMAFHVRDWSLDQRDAWMYGIVLGWGNALGEVARKHGWPAEDIDRLRRLRRQFLRRWHPPKRAHKGKASDSCE